MRFAAGFAVPRRRPSAPGVARAGLMAGITTLALVAATPAPSIAPNGPVAEVRLPGGMSDRGAMLREGNADYVSAADVMRWLSASREWNAELDKFTLRFRNHTLRFTMDTRWIQCDERMLQLDAPALYRRNMVWLPVSALTAGLPDGFRMRWDPKARRFDPAPPGSGGTNGLAGGIANSSPDAGTPAPVGQAPPAGAPNGWLPDSRGVARGARVVIDAGHGGAESGASGGGMRESELTLALALALKTELERTGDLIVVLTRDADREVPAQRRAETANAARGALFVSLHADAGPAGVKGFEVLCWPARATTGGPAPLPVSPPAPGSARAAPPPFEAWEDVPFRFHAGSDSLARDMQAALTQVWPDGGRGIVRRRLVPLEGVAMPAVMVECGTLTNAQDAELLSSPAGQARVAAALADGIRRRLRIAGPAPDEPGAVPSAAPSPGRTPDARAAPGSGAAPKSTAPKTRVIPA